MKTFFNALLKRFGLKLVRIIPELSKPASSRIETGLDGLKRLRDELTIDPLNPDAHLRLAIEADRCGRHHLAVAALKSAVCLGADPAQASLYEQGFLDALPDPRIMNHNQYFRFATLAAEIKARAGGGSDVSILDVGGGQGELASFLPDAEYCLAEPSVNGLSGTDLPFVDHSFDFVVACHVLEHIPVESRPGFLDQLLAKSRRGVILLNPFHVEGTHVEERLRLTYEITGAQWAQEHLDCTLPHVEDIEKYASKMGLDWAIRPSGTLATTMAFVFLDHFAAKSEQARDWVKINQFFNEKYMGILDSKFYPTAYLVYLTWPNGKQIPVLKT